jgi:hypothetical protein
MISLKYLVIILLIIFLIIIIIKLNGKNKNTIHKNNLLNYMKIIENMQDTTLYVRDEIILEEMTYPVFEENFKFDTMEKVSNNIEKFFNTYLDLINTNRINQKLNEYLVNKGDLNTISMQSIFIKKNLNLNTFSNKVYSLINKIYFANSKYINEDKLNLFGLFNVIKLKLNDTNLFTYNFYNKYYFVLVPKTMPNFVINEETLNDPNNIFEEEIPIMQNNNLVGISRKRVDKTLKTNINECYNETDKSNICKIGIKDLAGQDLIKKYSKKTDNQIKYDFLDIRKELANNLDKIIELCELYIVRELILAYNDALSTDNNNTKNTDKFKSLETEISNVFDSIQTYDTYNINNQLDIRTILNDDL